MHAWGDGVSKAVNPDGHCGAGVPPAFAFGEHAGRPHYKLSPRRDLSLLLRGSLVKCPRPSLERPRHRRQAHRAAPDGDLSDVERRVADEDLRERVADRREEVAVT